MAYNRTQVRELLNASERELFEASLATPIRALSAAQLRSRIGRTRTLRDKYRDLLQRQKIATRGRTGSKTGTTGLANQRTDKKAAVLAEVLGRYEARQARLDASARRAADKTAEAEQASKRAGKSPPAAVREAATKTRQELPKAGARRGKTSPQAGVAGTVPKTGTARRAVAKPAAAVLRDLLDKRHAGDRSTAPGAPSRRRKAPAKVPAPSADALGPTSESARATRFARQQLESGSQRIQGHVGTQIRRAQAKRDDRG
jgi:hypothetical protein